jgi:hypothetical protein
MDKQLIGKIILPAAIVVAAGLIGLSLYAVQVEKQQSIERQANVAAEIEREKAAFEKNKAEADLAWKLLSQSKMTECLNNAEIDRMKYARLNGTENADGSVSAPAYVWDRAEKQKKETIDTCLKQFGN